MFLFAMSGCSSAEMVIVTKFGGTSVANGHNLEQVINIILESPKRRVNVLS